MTASPLRPGSRLGGYVLVRPLGRGGMGTVYEALDEGLGRRVALKVVSRELRLDRRALERFKREARASAALVHPNITAVHAIGEDHETIFVVLELLERGTLQDRLSKEGPLPWQEAAGLAAGVARGLAAIHAIGLVHRDVKPSNILLDDEGRPKLSDFGLVALPGVTQLTRTGEFVGTPQFMAPEQMGAHGETDARSDLYALGATLYALLAGRPPLEGQGAEILMKLARERPRSVRELVPEIPESLDRIVLRLLEKRKEGRGTALEVASELEAIAWGDTTRMREAAAGGRPGLLLALVGSAAVVAVAAAVVAATGSSVGRKSDSDPGPARGTVASNGSRATDARPVETSTPAPAVAPAFPGCCDGFLLSRDGGYRLAQVLGSYDGRHNDVVVSVSISPDGTRALSGGRVEPFRGVADPPILWDLATGKELMALRDLAKRDVAASVWFEDGTRVLVAYGAQLLILDTRTGKVRDTLKGHRKPVRSLALSADGHVALSGSEDSTIRVWDLDTGKCLREVTNHRESVVAVAFAPDGASALSASQDGELRRWKLATGEVTGSVASPGPASAAALSPDGTLGVHAGPAGEVVFFDLAGFQVQRRTGPGPRKSALVFSADGKKVLAGRDDGRVEILDAATGESGGALVAHRAPVLCIRVTGDGRRAVSASDDGSIQEWDLEARKALHVNPGHRGACWALAVSPDGKRLVSGGLDGTIAFYDAASGSQIDLVLAHQGRIVRGLAVTPDGKQLVSTGDDAKLEVRDMASRTLVRSIDLTGPGYALALAEDGRTALVGQPGGYALLVDLQNESWPRPLVAQKGDVHSVALSPDGRRALTASYDCTGCCWDLSRVPVQPVATFRDTSEISAVIFDRDCRTAYTANREAVLKRWDVESGKLVRAFKGHGKPWTLSLALVGRRLVSTGGDATIRVWDAESGAELDLIKLESSSDMARKLACAPDGRSFYACTERGVVLRFEPTGK